MTNDHEKHLTYQTLDDLSKEEANKYLNQLIEECEECAFELYGVENPSLELVQLAQKASLQGQGNCPENYELAEYAMMILSLQKSVEMAAHISDCKSCYTELFDEGLADRVNEVIRKRAQEATDKALEKIKEYKQRKQ